MELFLYMAMRSMSCADADALLFRIKAQNHLDPKIQIELVDTIKDYVPECDFYWDAND